MAFDYLNFYEASIEIEKLIQCNPTQEDAFVRVCVHALYYSAFHQLGIKYSLETRLNVRGKHDNMAVFLENQGLKDQCDAFKGLKSLRNAGDYDCLQTVPKGPVHHSQPFTIAVELTQAKDYCSKSIHPLHFHFSFPNQAQLKTNLL